MVKRDRLLGLIAVGGAALFGAALIVQPIYRHDRVLAHPYSEYAMGPYGWVQTAAFVPVAVGSIALVVGLSRALTAPNARSGVLLLALWASGVLIAAMFPIQGEITAQIHTLASMLSLLTIVGAMVVLSTAFRRDDQCVR